MEVVKGKLYGVVTGDVVDSSKLSQADRRVLFEQMKAASRELRQWLGEVAMPLEVDIYGGDSWQMLLTQPEKSLAAGLLFRAFLKAHPPGCDSRFTVAIDSIDFIPGKSVSEGDGAAFRHSGQMLASGLGKRRMGFATGETVEERDTTEEDTTEAAQPSPSWDLVYEILDAIVTHWSKKQALAMTGALRGWTQDETGKLWTPPIEQPTINRTLRAGRWSAVWRAIEEFEQTWGT